MPYISIRIASDDMTESQTESLAKGTTRIMSEVLGKKPELTAVSIEQVPASQWYIGGENIAKAAQRSAYVTAKVSAGTNTEKQIAEAVNAFYQLLSEHLGALSETSYVVIDEVPTKNWGYGGRTQQDRQIKRTEGGSIDTTYYMDKGRQARAEAAAGLSLRFLQR